MCDGTGEGQEQLVKPPRPEAGQLHPSAVVVPMPPRLAARGSGPPGLRFHASNFASLGGRAKPGCRATRRRTAGDPRRAQINGLDMDLEAFGKFVATVSEDHRIGNAIQEAFTWRQGQHASRLGTSNRRCGLLLARCGPQRVSMSGSMIALSRWYDVR